MTIFRTLRLAAAVFLASVSALALADNFLRDDGTFQPITSSSQSVTATAPITVTPTPCVGSCTIALTVPITVPQGGTGNITATAHSLPINEGTGAQANTGAGTTGQCMGSGGGSADPSYASGCWRLLNTLTASASSSLSDTTNITSTYNDYLLVFENLLPTNTNTTCEIQVHSGGTFKSTTYLASNNFGTIAPFTSATFIPCSQSANVPNTGPGISGSVMAFNPSSSAQATIWSGQLVYITSAAQINQVGGIWNSAAATDGFQIIPVGGASPTWASGTVKLYGRL